MAVDPECGAAEGQRCASHNILGMRCELPRGHVYFHGATADGVGYAWSDPPPDMHDANPWGWLDSN